MNKCFLLKPEKKIGTDLSCRFREKRNSNAQPLNFDALHSEKMTSLTWVSVTGVPPGFSYMVRVQI